MGFFHENLLDLVSCIVFFRTWVISFPTSAERIWSLSDGVTWSKQLFIIWAAVLEPRTMKLANNCLVMEEEVNITVDQPKWYKHSSKTINFFGPQGGSLPKEPDIHILRPFSLDGFCRRDHRITVYCAWLLHLSIQHEIHDTFCLEGRTQHLDGWRIWEIWDWTPRRVEKGKWLIYAIGGHHSIWHVCWNHPVRLTPRQLSATSFSIPPILCWGSGLSLKCHEDL